MKKTSIPTGAPGHSNSKQFKVIQSKKLTPFDDSKPYPTILERSINRAA